MELNIFILVYLKIFRLLVIKKSYARSHNFFLTKEYGECTTSRRMNCPKRFHEKIFYLSCIFL